MNKMGEMLMKAQQSDHYTILIACLCQSMTALKNLLCIDPDASESVKKLINEKQILGRLAEFIDSAQELNLNFIDEATGLFEIMAEHIKNSKIRSLLEKPGNVDTFIQSLSTYMTCTVKSDQYQSIHMNYLGGIVHLMGMESADLEDFGVI